MTDTEGEPVRWLDDPGAPAELRADLEALRAAPTPPIDEAAGLLALRRRIQTHGGAGSGGGAGGGASGAAIALGVVGVIGAISLGSWLAVGTSDREPAAAPVTEPVTASSTESGAPPMTSSVAPPEPEPASTPPATPDLPSSALPEARPEASEAPASEAPDRRAADETIARTAEPRPRLSADDRLRREMQLLEEARRTVDRDPRAALASLATARREIGTGTFGDEREALRALALFALHRDAEARPLAERILRRDPEGLYAARLRESLASAP